MEPKVLRVPEHIDQEVARLKLKGMNISIDTLTEEQRSYLEDVDK